MSGPPRKLKKPLLSGTMRTLDDEPMKPKPSINARGMQKRMLSRGAMGSYSKIPRLEGSGEASTSAGLPPPPRALIEYDDLKVFAAKGKCDEVDNASIRDALNTAVQEAKFNKFCRLIVAYLIKVAKPPNEAFDASSFEFISTLVAQNAAKLTNVYMLKVIFWTLANARKMSVPLQTLLVNMLTEIAEAQPVLNPIFAQQFVADCLGERVWADKQYSAKIVALILRRFNTRFPDASFYRLTGDELSPPIWSPNTDVVDKFPADCEGLTETELEKERRRRRKEKESVSTVEGEAEKEEDALPPLKINVLDDVLSTLRPWWETRSDKPSRGLLYAMNMFCGVPEVRAAAANRLDGWLQNPKVQRLALELLLQIGVNFTNGADDTYDAEVLKSLFRLKCIKSKQVQQVLCASLAALCEREENVGVIVRQLILNELGPPQQRLAQNMMILPLLFAVSGPKICKAVGEELCEVLFSRHEMLRAVLTLVKELVKSHLRADFLFARLVTAYLSRFRSLTMSGNHFDAASTLKTTISFCGVIVWIAIVPQVKDEFSKRRAGENYNQTIVSRFATELNDYFEGILKWLQWAKLAVFDDHRDFVTRLNSMLFLDKGSFIVSVESGPNEQEWAICQKIISEVHINAKIASLLLTDGLIEPVDALHILISLTDRMLKYATSADAELALVDGADISLFDAVFNVSKFRYKLEIPNSLAVLYVDQLYWLATQLVFMWATFGKAQHVKDVHAAYPTIRMLMLVALLENFKMPDSIVQELKAQDAEREASDVKAILDLEKFVSRRDDVSTANSELLKICSTISPRERARLPPKLFLDTISAFIRKHKISATLCRVRDPNLLVELVEKVGTAGALSSISSVLEHDASAVSYLPVQPVCEYLLGRAGTNFTNHLNEYSALYLRLRDEASLNTDPLFFFLSRPLEDNAIQPAVVYNILNILYSGNEYDQSTAYELPFLSQLVNAPYFHASRDAITLSLAQLCAGRFDEMFFVALISFIQEQLRSVSNLHEVIKPFTALIQRHAKNNALVGGHALALYANYVDVMRENPSPSNSADLCFVSTCQSYMSADAITGQIELLCSTSEYTERDMVRTRRKLLDIWFPEDGVKIAITKNGQPFEAFTQQMIADMLCTEDARIVNVALVDLSPQSALSVIQQFGLAVQCTSRLLSMLDLVDFTTISLSEAIAAHPFMKAYKARGATGGEKFLTKLAEQERLNNETKDESMEILSFINVKEPEYFTLPPPLPILSTADLAAKIKRVVAGTESAVVEPVDFKTVCASEEAAKAVVEIAEGNLKALLEKADIFADILQLLFAAAENFPSIKTHLSTWCPKVLRGARPPPQVIVYLRQYASTDDLNYACPNKFGCVFDQASSIDDLIATLNAKSEELNEGENAIFVTRWLEFRPTIIEFGPSLPQQSIALFSLHHKSTRWLCAQLPQLCPPKTQQAIVNFVLSKFDVNIDPLSVTGFMSYCISERRALLLKDASDTNLSILGQYIAIAIRTDPKREKDLFDTIDDLVKYIGFNILRPIVQGFTSDFHSTPAGPQRVTAEQLILKISDKYPCVQNFAGSQIVDVVGFNWRTDTANEKLTHLLTAMFRPECPLSVSKVLGELEVLMNMNSKVIEKQLGILSRLLAELVTMTTQAFNNAGFAQLILFLLDSLLRLFPTLDEASYAHVESLLSVILALYERHFTDKRNAQSAELREKTLQACVRYIDSDFEGSESFRRENVQVLERLGSSINDKSLGKYVECFIARFNAE